MYASVVYIRIGKTTQNTLHRVRRTTTTNDDDDELLHNGITTTVNYDRRQQNIGTE